MVYKIIDFDVYLRATNIETSAYEALPKVMSNDKNSVKIRFNVQDVEAEELAGATAEVLLFMKDGSFFQKPSSEVLRENTTFSYVLKANESRHVGVAKVQISIKFEGLENASKLYEFEIVGGLETKPILEKEIQDWTTLTAEAKAFIDEFKDKLQSIEVDIDLMEEAELTRIQAELDRQAQEEARKTAEAQREANEDDREANEQTRINKDRSRDDKIAQMEEAEVDRQEAELDKQAQEEARVTAEGKRVESEAEREANEQARLSKDRLRDDKIAQMEADKDAVIANATVDSEVILARGGKATLGQRLDETAQQMNNRIDNIIVTPAEGITQQEIIDARQNKASLGENLMTLKDNLKTFLEPTGVGNKEYTLQIGRFGSDGATYRDRDGAFLRYEEYFGGYGVSGVIRNTSPNKYNFDVIFYDQAQNFIKRDRGITNSKYVVDEKYLFRVAISRTDGAAIVESDKSEMHDAFFISDRLEITGNIDLGNNKSVKLENLVDKQRIIYPYPTSSLHLEKVDDVAVYVKADNIMVRNHSNGNIRFRFREINELLSEYIVRSPSGASNCIRIPEKSSLVYDVPENTLKIVGWGEIETTHDLLLLLNHDSLFGMLVDFVRDHTLEDISGKVDALSSTDRHVEIPTYWNEHIERKVDTIREKQLPLGKDGFSFGFITDIHYNPRNTRYKVSSPFIMSKIMEECDINLFVNGGDMGNQQNGEEGRKTILSDYYELMGLFKKSGIVDRMLPMVGNHESNTQNWKLGNGAFDNVAVHNDEVYSVLFRNTEKIPNINYGGDGLYYYVDDFANRIRYICLNTNDVEYTERVRIDFAIKQQQFDWLINEALELPNADWSVVLATHIPPVTQDFDDRGMPVKNMEILKGIIKAFKDKSQFSDSENHSNSIYNASVSVDFTGNENEFIVWIAGHHHRDHVTLVDNSYTVVLTADDGRRNFDNPIKTIGTDTEHVMDFFTVDKINKKVSITRVGAGEDREFTY